MLEFFRSFMKSKIGVGVTLGFLVLIALAFASADVSGSGKFGGVAGGDRVASVGKERISTSTLSQSVSRVFERYKKENPKLSMKAFLDAGGMTKVLDELIDRSAVVAFAAKYGIVAGDRLIDSEIAKEPAFRGPDGNFAEANFRQVLRQSGLDEPRFRELITGDLIQAQITQPISFGVSAPKALVTHFASMQAEVRSGAIAMLPSAAFAPKGEPSASDLAAFYAAHKDSYTRPERRVIRYATFDESAVKSVAAPTDAEVAARYEANKAQYAAADTRKLTQLVLPTEAAAKAVLDELAKGGSLDSAAKSKGLAAASLGSLTKEALALQASAAVADAAFGAAQGKIAGPAKGKLGWHLLRVDAIEHKPGKTLDQARPELVLALTAEKKRAALTDFSARIEDEFDNGGSLADVAKELAITPKLTEALTADGGVYGKPGQTGPAELARVIQTAFAMERENQPQLAEIVPGKTFMVFDVTAITAAAPAPIADVRAQVVADLMLQRGEGAAKAAARKLEADVRGGKDLAAAMAALGVALPPVDNVNMSRAQIASAGQGVPPPLGLLFAMAKGTVKVLAAPGNRGWYVVSLKTITPGKVDLPEATLAQARNQFGQVLATEYSAAMRRAIRNEMGVERNKPAIDAVSRQLTGAN